MSNVIHVRFARYREQGRTLLNARAVVLDAPQFALEGGTDGHATNRAVSPSLKCCDSLSLRQSCVGVLLA